MCFCNNQALGEQGRTAKNNLTGMTKVSLRSLLFIISFETAFLCVLCQLDFTFVLRLFENNQFNRQDVKVYQIGDF